MANALYKSPCYMRMYPSSFQVYHFTKWLTCRSNLTYKMLKRVFGSVFSFITPHWVQTKLIGKQYHTP